LNADFVTGLGTVDERLLILVDIGALLADAEFGLIEKMAA
jgi:purine-binding chemotaxis protein CheW